LTGLYFGGSKTEEKNRIPEDFFFSCVFRRNFSQECGFGGVAGIPVFGHCHRIFLQAGIPVFAPDSSGFLWIPPDSCSCQKLSG
jgi:hypothetical protein